MAETRNVIVGAAKVFISTSTSADETLTEWNAQLALTAVPATADLGGASWRNPGFTQEGVEVSYEPDYGDVEVDQLLDSARLFKQSMRVTANTTFAEATLENLLVVWGQQSRSLNGTTLDIEVGELGDEPVERGLVFVGPAPRSTAGARQERAYHVKRGIQTESSSHALRRNENTAFPVSFRLLPVPGQSGGKSLYGRITDRAMS